MASKSQVFTSSGTFTPADGVTGVRVTMVAGGGAGRSSHFYYNGGGGGGAGGCIVSRFHPVSGPVAVVIGAGGIPSPIYTYGFQGNGGDTSFGTLAVTGGQGGFMSDAGHAYAGNGGNAQGREHSSGTKDTNAGTFGMNNYENFTLANAGPGTMVKGALNFFGGANGGGGDISGGYFFGGPAANNHPGGIQPVGDRSGGGGASSPFGTGGAGADGASGAALAGANGSGYGSGGGGGTHTGIGGNGASGYCLVEWDE